MGDAVEIEALRAQLAAAEEQLMKNQEEKNAVAKELEQAQKEKADQQRKKAFLDETGLTEAEFEDKKAMVEVCAVACIVPAICGVLLSDTSG